MLDVQSGHPKFKPVLAGFVHHSLKFKSLTRLVNRGPARVNSDKRHGPKNSDST